MEYCFGRRAAVGAALAGLVLGLAACTPGRDPVDGRLERLFPAHAPQVLDAEGTFVPSEQGFATAVDAAARVSAELPRDGEGGIHIRRGPGFEVIVHERDCAGAAAPKGRAVSYPRAGGASYWSVSDAGVEEWLLLDAGLAVAGRPAAIWEIQGAALRQRGEAIELADRAGTARLRVTAPEAYAASGRAVAARLVARGEAIELYVDAGGEAVLVDPAWKAAGAMAFGHEAHTATLLLSGQVLVAGSVLDAELYDPGSDSWASANQMSVGREGHTATRLPNGKVLVTAGISGEYTPSCDLYDPALNTWNLGFTSLGASIAGHTATLLLNGKVLIAGGGQPGFQEGELFDPAVGPNGAFSPAAPPNSRSAHTATLLASGQVLVAGGHTANAELYEPALDAWTAVPDMSVARDHHVAALLPSGKVLIAGGYDFMAAPLASAEIFDPASKTWAAAPAMLVARAGAAAALLASGKVLVLGGFSGAIENSAELFDEATNAWKATASMQSVREAHTATLLTNGRVLAVGGFGGVQSAELYGGSPGDACTGAGDCFTGFCVSGVCCDTACTGTCLACSVAGGAAVDGTCGAATGPACSDGDACTQLDTCAAGVCTGVSPVTCSALDTCHAAGSCDAGTGKCSNPAKASGAACTDDGNACSTDLCDGAGTCTHPTVPDGTGCGAGQLCMSGSCGAKCIIGGTFYANGVGNPMNACELCDSQSSTTAWSKRMDGTACDDGNACTSSDVCTAGLCGGAAYACKASICQVSSTCDGLGGCAIVNKGNGAACPDDGNACTTDACDGSGTCAHPFLADGTSCGGGAVCQAGSCGAGCIINGALVGAGTLNPANACEQCAPATSTTSWSSASDGAVCDDGNPCTQGDACKAAACVGAPIPCTPGVCQAAGSCDPKNGCTFTSKPEGAPCPGGECVAGGCVLDPAGGPTGSGSSGSASGSSSGSASGSSSGAGGAVSASGSTGSGAGSGSGGGTGSGGAGQNGGILIGSGSCGLAPASGGAPGGALFAAAAALLFGLRRRREESRDAAGRVVKGPMIEGDRT